MANKSQSTWKKEIYPKLVILFHLISFSQYIFCIYYDLMYVHPIIQSTKGSFRPGFKRTPYGGKFKYLTFWNIIIQAIYFAIALLNDVFGTNEVTLPTTRVPFIRKLKDYLFAAFAFPVSFNVGIVFWALFNIDRELVFPKALDAFFPNWLNHIMHTNIMVFIVLELFTSFRTYPSRKAGLAGLSLLMGAYLGWIHVIKYKADVWVYPILEVLSLPLRIGFFLLVLLFSVGLYVFGEFFNEQIWVREIKHATKFGTKKDH